MMLDLHTGDQIGQWVIDNVLVFGEPALLAAHHVDDPEQKATLEIRADRGLARTEQNRIVTALQSFDHHAIPRLIEHGNDKDGRLFIAMRPFSCDNLSDRMVGRDYDWQHACAWLYRIAQALEHMHAVDWVHRDVNPQSIYVGNAHEAWLLGMGNALRVGEVANSDIPKGKLSYLAPEVLADSGYDPLRADVYSFGCVAYELLRGEPAFPAAAWAENADRKRMMHEWKARASALDPGPGVPDWLRTLVRKCADPEAEQRLPDMDSVMNWLEGSLGAWMLPEPPITATPAFVVSRSELPKLTVQPTNWNTEAFAEAVALRALELQQPQDQTDIYYTLSIALGMAAGLAISVLTILFVELSLLT